MTTAADDRTYVLHLSDSPADDIRFDSTDVLLNAYALVECDEDGSPVYEWKFATRHDRDSFAKANRLEIVNYEWIADCRGWAVETDADGNEYGEVECAFDLQVGYAVAAE